MGDDDHRTTTADFLSNHFDQSLNRTRVEAARWLVQHQKPRPMHQGARERHTLPLASRIRSHGSFREGTEVEPIAGRRECVLDLACVEPRRELDVLPTGEIRIAKRFMPHPAKTAAHGIARASEATVIDPSRCGSCERPDDGEQRRLARTIRPLNHDRLSVPEPAGNPDERPDGPVRLCHLAKLDQKWTLRAGSGGRQKAATLSAARHALGVLVLLCVA